MYPGITKFREEVTARASHQGYIAMGLGARIIVDDIKRDERTVFNSQSQFWSILTLIALAKFHHAIESAGMQSKVKIVNTIYDAIYMEATEDPATIQWVNDTLTQIMAVDFIHNQTVHNEAELDIGYNLANMLTLPHNCSIEHITDIINQLKEE